MRIGAIGARFLAGGRRRERQPLRRLDHDPLVVLGGVEGTRHPGLEARTVIDEDAGLLDVGDIARRWLPVVRLGPGRDQVLHLGAVPGDLRCEVVERVEAGQHQRLARGTEAAARAQRGGAGAGGPAARSFGNVASSNPLLVCAARHRARSQKRGYAQPRISSLLDSVIPSPSRVREGRRRCGGRGLPLPLPLGATVGAEAVEVEGVAGDLEIGRCFNRAGRLLARTEGGVDLAHRAATGADHMVVMARRTVEETRLAADLRASLGQPDLAPAVPGCGRR